jgi:hypothetical protein
MKDAPTQLDMREHTASSRRHASRLTVNLSSCRETSVADLLRKDEEDIRPEISNAHPSYMPTAEPFVSADRAAQFLSVKRRYLLELARRGIPGAYPLCAGNKRKTWVFRLSELSASVAAAKTELSKSLKACTIRLGSPR